VPHDRGIRHDLAARLDLAIEQAERIPLEPAMAVGTEHVEVTLAELSQALAVDRAAGLIAERVQLETCFARADALQVASEEQQQLGVGERIRAPQQLGPDLVELPIPTLLRTLAPEHRPDVEEPGLRI